MEIIGALEKLKHNTYKADRFTINLQQNCNYTFLIMETIEELKKQGYKLSNFYKEQDSDKVYWIASDHIGEHMFSFDKKINLQLIR